MTRTTGALLRGAGSIVILLFASTALGGDTAYSIGGKKVPFVHDPRRHMILSRDCQRGHGSYDCEAFRALSKASLRGVYSRGGESPGAIICGSRLKGEVVIGTDSDGDQNSFCRFGDGSMVSCGSLTWHGRSNDLKRIE